MLVPDAYIHLEACVQHGSSLKLSYKQIVTGGHYGEGTFRKQGEPLEEEDHTGETGSDVNSIERNGRLCVGLYIVYATWVVREG